MDITLRLATKDDIEVIFDIRTSVKENHLSKQQLTELGITESVILDLIQNTSTIWLAEMQHQVYGFSIADLTEGSVFAMSTLITILNSAVEDGLISTNPAARWGRVVRAEQTEVEEVEAFTPEELTRLLDVTERSDPDAYPFVLCLARTGLRVGEGMYSVQRPAATTSTRRMTPKIARVCVHVARTASTVAGSAVLSMLSGDNGCSAMREIPGSRESS